MGREPNREHEIYERSASSNLLAVFNRYGLPGLVILLMAAFIWIMFQFIAGGLSSKLSAVDDKEDKIISVEYQQLEVLKNIQTILQTERR